MKALYVGGMKNWLVYGIGQTISNIMTIMALNAIEKYDSSLEK